MSGIDYSKMTEAELEAAFEAEKAGAVNEPEPQPSPEPTPEPSPEPASEPETKDPSPETPPEAPEKQGEDVESELAAMDVEKERLRREKLEADLEMQKAHASRLAGEIGYLREQMKSIPHASEPYEPQSQAEFDRLATLEQDFAREKQRRVEAEVSQAVGATINALDGPWSKDLSAEIAQVAPKYAEQIKTARETSDPILARQIVTAVVQTIQAEAREMAWTTRRKSLEEKRTVQLAELTARKKAAGASGGGAVASARPKPKTYDDMTPAELDAEMEKEFGRR